MIKQTTMLCLLLLSVTTIQRGYGQDNPTIGTNYQHLIPPSPNASALGEYGNTPISLATGTPNISIPLWEIKGTQLSIPVSLSYRASGVKVEDAGSAIGLGWALNAGGVVTRSIRDKAESQVNQHGIVPARPEGLPYTNTITESQVNDLGTYDNEPDIYYYNFPGHAGKFIFRKDGTPVIMPDVALDVRHHAGQIVITDTQGIKYYFGKQEFTNGEVTAWYLTQIASVDGAETIDFHYVTESYNSFAPGREIMLANAAIQRPEEETEMDIQRSFTTLRLSSITSSFGVSMSLISGNPRIDYLGGRSNKAKCIAEIAVSYRGQCVRRFRIENEFVETSKPLSSLHWGWDFFDMSWANYRMYLKSLTEYSCDYSDGKKYQFDYYGRTVHNKDELPHRMSYAQDHWGYYNGKDDNATLRPTFTAHLPRPQGSIGTPIEKTVLGADRNPSFPEMQAGTLKSITYATGGKTAFNYESHEGIDVNMDMMLVGGLRVSAVSDYDQDGITLLKKKSYEYAGGYLDDFPNYTSNDERVLELNDVLHKKSVSANNCLPNTADNSEVISVHSGSPVTLGATNGYHLTYGSVKEIEEGNGYTRYGYTTSANFYDKHPIGARVYYNEFTSPSGADGWFDAEIGWPYVPKTDYSWKRGLLTGITYVSEEGEEIKSIRNEYERISLGRVNALKYIPFYYPYPVGFGEGVYECHEVLRSYWVNYVYDFGISRVTRQTITEDGVTKITETSYDDQNMVARTKETNSNGQVTVNEYDYPFSQIFDGSPSFGSELLRAKHMVSTVLRSSTFVDDILVSKTETTYGAPFDDAASTAIEGPLVPVAIAPFPDGSTPGRVAQFTYKENGTIAKVTMGQDETSQYVWGYQGQLPVIKAEQAGTGFDGTTESSTTLPAGYATLAALLDDLDNICEDRSQQNLWRSYNQSLRHQHPDAMIYTYTYHPQVGMTSSTDPNGNTFYYRYDALGRLRLVRDHDGYILKRHDYTYFIGTN